MWYLLLVYALTGEPVSQDLWHLDHKFATLEACTAKKLTNQRLIDAAWVKDGGKEDMRLEFQCHIGPELLTKENDENIENRTTA